jgi:hypothetical protein
LHKAQKLREQIEAQLARIQKLPGLIRDVELPRDLPELLALPELIGLPGD